MVRLATMLLMVVLCPRVTLAEDDRVLAAAQLHQNCINQPWEPSWLPSFVDKFCLCVGERMAEKLSTSELHGLATGEQFAPSQAWTARIFIASATCELREDISCDPIAPRSLEVMCQAARSK
jgi:hypothetical protein